MAELADVTGLMIAQKKPFQGWLSKKWRIQGAAIVEQ